jgi:hypothetical protein
MTTISSYLDAIPRERGGALTRTERWRRTITLAVSLDAVMLLLAVLLSYRIRELAWFTSHDSPIPEAWWTVPAIAVLWLLALRQTGAYSIRHMRAGVTEYKRVVSASLVVAGVVGVTCYLTAYEFARVFFVSYFLIGLSGLVLVRFVRRRVMHRLHLHGLLLTPVIVAGRTGHVDSVAKVLRREKWLGYDVVGAITRKGERTTPTGLPVLGHVSDIAGVLARHDVAAVIFAEDGLGPGGARRPDDRGAERGRHQRPAPRRPAGGRAAAGRRGAPAGDRGDPLDQAQLRPGGLRPAARPGRPGAGRGGARDLAGGPRAGALPAGPGRPRRRGVQLPEVPQHVRGRRSAAG